MSVLGDAVGSLFGDGADLREQLDELKAHHGGVSGLARHLGVARTTVQRWQRGATSPKEASRSRIGSEYRNATVPEHGDIRSIGTTEASGRPRSISGGYIRPGTMDKVRETYIHTGDKEAAGKVLWKGITDDFYMSHLADSSYFEDEDLTYEGYAGYADDLISSDANAYSASISV